MIPPFVREFNAIRIRESAPKCGGVGREVMRRFVAPGGAILNVVLREGTRITRSCVRILHRYPTPVNDGVVIGVNGLMLYWWKEDKLYEV